jgi:putative transposase
VTRPLDGLALHTYCRRLGFSQDAETLIATIRSSPPHRTPRGNHGNMPVWYPSKKMSCVIKAESHRVEFAFLLEAEYGDDVLEYFDQPSPPLRLEYRDKQGHRQTPLHTADYFVLSYHAAGWQECKPVEELTRLADSQPNRYVLDAQGRWRCPPGEAYAARLGLTYQVRASDQINWVAQENWLVLEDYYHDLERLEVPEDVLLTLRRVVDETPGMTLAEIHRVTPSLPTDWINIAIAKRHMYVDLLAHRLTDRGRTPVYPDEPTARAWTHRTPHPVQHDPSAHPVLMEHGQQIAWDGHPWIIGNIGETEVTLISKIGLPFALAKTAFEVLVKESKIVGRMTSLPSNFTEEGRTRLAQASEQDLATAVFRHRVIHPEAYDDEEQRRLVPHIAAVPLRTKYHWQRLDREGDSMYGSGFIGLLPRYQQCGGARKLDPAVITLMEEVLRSHYDTVIRKLKRGAYGEYLLQSKEQGLRSVSQSTFYAQAKQHLSTYDQTLVREGKRAAYPYKDVYRTGTLTTSRHGMYAWSMAHIDHTELDLELFDSATDQPLGKCWLTLMILSHPRRIVALSLSFDPPSYRSCLSVLRECVKRFGYLPTAITVDGGPEFRSTYFEQLLALYVVRKHQRPASEPRYGAPQERLFGTMNTQFIYHLLGNTQALKKPRQLSAATDPRKLGVWTLPKLAERVVRWAYAEYDQQPHTALGMTPRAAYEQSLKQDGARSHRMIPYDDTFKIATFPTTAKGKALVQPGRGARINHLDYWCEAMRDPTVERTWVPVRYDPFDVSVGYVYLKGCWRKCIIAYDELAGCSERELQIIAEEVRKRKRLLQGRTQVEVTQQQLAQFRRDNAATEVVLRQQRKDRETLAALRALGGQSSPTPSPQPASPPVSGQGALDAADSSPSTKTERASEDKLLIFRRIR